MKNRYSKTNSLLGVVFLCLLTGSFACGGGGIIDDLNDLNVRRIDGSENNFESPDWGSAGTQLKRLSEPAYADGVSEPAGQDRPNPREISNEIFSQGQSIPNNRGLSNFVWQWGQFVDHDIDLSPDDRPGDGNPGQPLPIPVPAGDPFFDPGDTGNVVISFFRSVFDPTTGDGPGNPRQQVNVITAWIDASNVYGSDEERALWLRTGEGGQLKVSPGDLMPFNEGILPNAPNMDPQFFIGGDIRANEQAALAAMHTLFLREHNRLAAEIQEKHPEWDDERIYQRARKFVGAFIEVITFYEFLPALLGPHAPKPYKGYRPEVEPSIFNEFSTALYRFGHTMLTSDLLRLDNEGNIIPEGPLPLRDAFFEPTLILLEGGIDPLLLGLANQPMEEVDAKMVDDVRNFLFGAPGAGGMDLGALNIQRARDHGLPDLNTLRADLGLPPFESFAELSSDPNLAQALEDLYGDIHKIDPWVGLLAEDHLPGASAGETLTVGLMHQFERLRKGDRFWCERDPAFSPEVMQEILNTRLSDIIRRNTGITNIQDNVFFIP